MGSSLDHDFLLCEKLSRNSGNHCHSSKKIIRETSRSRTLSPLLPPPPLDGNWTVNRHVWLLVLLFLFSSFLLSSPPPVFQRALLSYSSFLFPLSSSSSSANGGVWRVLTYHGGSGHNCRKIIFFYFLSPFFFRNCLNIFGDIFLSPFRLQRGRRRDRK